LMAAVSDADLLLPLSLPFERTVIARIHDLEPDLPVCRAVPTIEAEAEVLTAEVFHHDDLSQTSHNHSQGPDPHFWLNPKQTAEYAQRVQQCLCESRPQTCHIFTENREAYTEELAAADSRIAKQLAPYSGRSFFVFHPAFGHFAQRYGLRQVAVEFEGKNPTGRHLAEVIEHAKAQDVRVIFVQPQFAGTGAQAVAAAVGADLVELDPLAPDLLANLERIATRMVNVFVIEKGSTK
jgi:zinc transport system substrate-binding protein